MSCPGAGAGGSTVSCDENDGSDEVNEFGGKVGGVCGLEARWSVLTLVSRKR